MTQEYPREDHLFFFFDRVLVHHDVLYVMILSDSINESYIFLNPLADQELIKMHETATRNSAKPAPKPERDCGKCPRLWLNAVHCFCTLTRLFGEKHEQTHQFVSVEFSRGNVQPSISFHNSDT
jgi:hypothetical protein